MARAHWPSGFRSEIFSKRAGYLAQFSARRITLTRFFRWASDRLHDDGILAFITNRSFVDIDPNTTLRLLLDEIVTVKVKAIDYDCEERPVHRLTSRRTNDFDAAF